MSSESNPVPPPSSGQPAKAQQQQKHPKPQKNQQNQQKKQQNQKPKAEPKPAGPEIDLENKDLPPYVDTHCHIPYILDKMHLGTYAELRQKHKYPANYEASVCVFCDPAAFSPSFATWPDLLKEPDVYGAFGIHPHNAKHYTDKVEEQIAEAMKHPKAVAWGECGLDYHYNNSTPEDQRRVFARQCAMAVSLGKPLVVHSREADDDTFDILQKSVPKDWRIHVHCFGSTAAVAKRLTDEFPNLFIGITGVVTFGSAKDQKEAVIATPLDRLLLETDAPYMMPTKARSKHGHVCHPGHIPWVAAEIASLKGLTMEAVYKQVRENTKKMYGI